MILVKKNWRFWFGTSLGLHVSSQGKVKIGRIKEFFNPARAHFVFTPCQNDCQFTAAPTLNVRLWARDEKQEKTKAIKHYYTLYRRVLGFDLTVD